MGGDEYGLGTVLSKQQGGALVFGDCRTPICTQKHDRPFILENHLQKGSP